MMESAIIVLSSLTHQAVCMGMEIDAVAEGLDAGHNPRHKLCASDCLEVFEEGLDSRLAWQEGQKPRVRQEKQRRCSVPHEGQRMRAKPQRGLPQSR
jgi:hypothetical protein